MDDPVSRFGVMLRESAERERAERERKEQRKRDAAEEARAARARADALAAAQRHLERAIENVKRARAKRSGVDEADAAWREAKARLIELETGTAPDWAPSTASGEHEVAAAGSVDGDDSDAADDDTADAPSD